MKSKSCALQPAIFPFPPVFLKRNKTVLLSKTQRFFKDDKSEQPSVDFSLKGRRAH